MSRARVRRGTFGGKGSRSPCVTRSGGFNFDIESAFDSISSGGFGAVHGIIGQFQHGILGVFRASEADSQANSNRQAAVAAWNSGPRNTVTNVLSQVEGAIQIVVGG